MKNRIYHRNFTSRPMAATIVALIVVWIPVHTQAAPVVGFGLDCTSIETRPLKDFTSEQGKTSTFFPTVPDQIGWVDGEFTTFALVDYLGAWSNDAAISGRILECELHDGSARLSIVLNTRNTAALAQCVEDIILAEFEFPKAPTVFGNLPMYPNPDQSATSSLRATFSIEQPGAPLPDLLDVIANPAPFAPVRLHFIATARERAIGAHPTRLHIDQSATTVDGELVFAKEDVSLTGRGCSAGDQ